MDVVVGMACPSLRQRRSSFVRHRVLSEDAVEGALHKMEAEDARKDKDWPQLRKSLNNIHVPWEVTRRLGALRVEERVRKSKVGRVYTQSGGEGGPTRPGAKRS